MGRIITQHKWQTIDGFEVLAGWDRPLSHYFFQISRKCRGCGGEGSGQFEGQEDIECLDCYGRGEQFVFDNLDARSSGDLDSTDFMGGMTIAQVKKVLEKYLTAWPPKFLETIGYDAVANVGNQIYSYDTVGTVKLASSQQAHV
jgi:hypothetical protein